MQTSQVILLTVVSIILVTSAFAKSIPVSHRNRRSTADIRIIEHQAEIGLGRHSPKACKLVGCGLLDLHLRSQRATSDQRLAELRALINLAKGGGALAHGQIDPYGIGKRKRSYDQNDFVDYNDGHGEEKLLLLRRILDDLMSQADES